MNWNCFNRLALAVAIFFSFICATKAATNVNIDGTDIGRAYEGIGAVSAGANTRLLIDYNDPYRSDILDYLFKPKFGAGFQHLKVELGGGTNSTSGAEPSHAINRDEVNEPVSRGYEFWFMAEARDRNPDIILDYLPWALPYWLSSQFSQDTADYFTAFLGVAADDWGLDIDWCSGAQNEMGTSWSWVTNDLRPTMDAAGFSSVKIQSPDDNSSYWDIFDEFISHPAYEAVVDAVGYHYIDQGGSGRYPSASDIATGKPLWCSEDSVSNGAWSSGREIVRRMNKLYINGKITKQQIWCPVDSCAQGVVYSGVGAMQAETPWSGYYVVRPAIWCIAHYTQFTEPGWTYIDSGCGFLSGAGNYATLKDPGSSDWSMIIYSESAEAITVNLSGGLSTGTVHVWKSDSTDQFIQQSDVNPVSGSFTINCDAEALYSLTTTTGQQKGQAANPIPAEANFPFPYSEDYEDYNLVSTPKYHSDMLGTFEVANCKGGRSGKCLEQLLPDIGYEWVYNWVNADQPLTILSSEDNWTNYEASLDVYIEEGDVFLSVRKGYQQIYMGYCLVLDKSGNWKIVFDETKNPDNILDSSTIPGFDGDKWHNIKVRCADDVIDAWVDGRRISQIRDSQRSSGQVCFGSSFHYNQFDNLSVYHAGSDGSMWTKLDDTDESLTWINYWGDWEQSEYYGGSCKYSEVVGSAMEFPFYGKIGRVIGLLRNDLGFIDVYVDDVFQKSVDCYSNSTGYQVVLYETNELPLDNHTIRAEVTGNQNPSSSGFEIVLDAFSSTQTDSSIWCLLENNLSLAATASASSEYSASYSADKSNDGDWNTRWNSNTGDTNGAWLEMDFGKEVTFNRARFQQYDDSIQSYKIQHYDGSWKDAYVGGFMSKTPETVVFDEVTGTKARILVVTATATPTIFEFEAYSPCADIDGSGKVNLADLALFCEQWVTDNCDMSCDCDKADLYHDGIVNLRDYSIISGEYKP